MSNVLNSKRFVVRKSLVGKNQLIEVTFKSGNKVKYNHDKVYELMKANYPAGLSTKVTLQLTTYQLYFVIRSLSN